CTRCGAHRGPHSSPTRRSSDLEARGFRAGLLRAAEECEGCAAVVADEYDDGPHSVHADVARHLAKELREIADRDAPAAQPDPPPDRKSTRLNSSHVKISYAVFC